MLSNNRSMLSNPMLQQGSSLDRRLPGSTGAPNTPTRTVSRTVERPSAGSLPSHVYDEIVVPTAERGLQTPLQASVPRPPVPPRPSRTPSRSPPAIPISETEEG